VRRSASLVLSLMQSSVTRHCSAARCVSNAHRSLPVTSSRLPRSTDTAASCTLRHVTRTSAQRRTLAHLLSACVYVLLLGKPKPRE
jgi:hypothetical protein